MIDMQWAVCLSNWLARIACSLVRENIVDKSGVKARIILSQAIEDNPEGVQKRLLLRSCRSLTAGDLQAAADFLGLVTEKRHNGSNPSIW